VTVFDVRMPAPDGERFAPDAFDRSLGNRMAVRRGSALLARGTLVEARVEPDGLAAWLSILVDPDGLGA
jgi:hypothetical protein